MSVDWAKVRSTIVGRLPLRVKWVKTTAEFTRARLWLSGQSTILFAAGLDFRIISPLDSASSAYHPGWCRLLYILRIYSAGAGRS